MQKWIVRYTRIPTNYNDSRNAIVEAETAGDARKLLSRELGEGNGVHNYVIEQPREYVEEKIAGRIISMG